MTRLFRSKSCGLVGLSDPVPTRNDAGQEDGKEKEEQEEELESEVEESCYSNPTSTPFISPRPGPRGGGQPAILDMLAAALRKSLVTCSVETGDVASSRTDTTTTCGGMDIGLPTNVRHVSHVTFDSFNGFLGLPSELQPEVPRRVPSASAKVFGVSAKSMQCSYDDRGNSVPTILLMMQRRLYVEGGLKAEGIFRINAENGQEEFVRDQLNNGVVPRGIDVYCLAGLIKAWFRELPSGVLDSLSPEEVMHCNSEDDCAQLVMLLPPTEAALLNWAINLMTDVADHEQYNKMNARNIAMVFAPNMTQMADPLTALMHAVQVMNLLKTLILKTLRERDDSTSKSRPLSSASDCPSDNTRLCQPNPKTGQSHENFAGPCKPDAPVASKFLRSTTMNRLEYSSEEYWNFRGRITREEESVSLPACSRPSSFKSGSFESGCKDGSENGERLSFREGVKRLCRHPVFQLGKPDKKTRGLGIVNTC